MAILQQSIEFLRAGANENRLLGGRFRWREFKQMPSKCLKVLGIGDGPILLGQNVVDFLL
jgi:hypothetical protein